MIYSIEDIKAIVTPIAQKHGIPAVFLFGSYARGMAAISTCSSTPVAQTSRPCCSWARCTVSWRRLCKSPLT